MALVNLSPPRAEAWIETFWPYPPRPPGALSPPARRRGLKHLHLARVCRQLAVASRAEAWIETESGG